MWCEPTSSPFSRWNNDGFNSALRLGDLIIAEATLSFLGLGIQPPTPSWGSMVAEGQSVLLSGWWLATFPGIAIAVLVILLAVTGDVVQHAAGNRSPC